MKKSLALAFAAVLTLSVVVPSAQAQGWKDRLKQKVQQRVDQRTDQAADKGLDKVECTIPGTKCDAPSAAAANGANSATADAPEAKAANLKPGEGAWRNYDFVPGDRVILAEDFGSDKVGDFPKRFTFASGNLEIIEWSGARYLSTNTFDSRFSIPLPEVLPQRFTLEFDYSAAGGNGMEIYFTDPTKAESPSYIDMGTWYGGLRGGGIDALGKPLGDEYKYKNSVFPVRIMADGNHVKVYMGDTRVANVPNAKLGRSNAIWFRVPGREDRAAMIGNVRIAAGGRALYDALAESGRVATHGILFDTGSDNIRAESTPTLKEMVAMLTEHPELSLTIEGHTDNVGDAQANLALSAKRAEAVKAYLVGKGVSADRLATKGLGATKPAAPNTTEEGRQQNRRVELVKK